MAVGGKPSKASLELRRSAASPYPSPYSHQIVNQDYRCQWGDARNSTITFSEDQESGFGVEGGIGSHDFYHEIS